MNTIEVGLNQIVPYANNAKKHSKQQIANVAESIKQFGWRQPIVLDKNKVIIIGHCRWLAAKKLKLKTAPCHYALDLSEEQVKKLRNLDNKLNESEWDYDLLREDIADLDFGGFDLDWGVPEIEDEVHIKEIPAPAIDETKVPRCKIGEVWKLGVHRLLCGDCTSVENVKKLMIEGGGYRLADLLITDPPYNVNYEGKTKEALKIENDSMSPEAFKEFLLSAFDAAVANMKDGAIVYVWYASREHINFETALRSAGVKVAQQLIWVKNSMTLGRQDYQWKHEPCMYGWKEGAAHNWYGDRSQTTVLEFNKPLRNDDHPTMKPVELIAYQIKNSSKKGDIVLDLFGGSGTTLIACEQLERVCCMMEIDPRYCDVIIKRWETLTGEKAERLL